MIFNLVSLYSLVQDGAILLKTNALLGTFSTHQKGVLYQTQM